MNSLASAMHFIYNDYVGHHTLLAFRGQMLAQDVDSRRIGQVFAVF